MSCAIRLIKVKLVYEPLIQCWTDTSAVRAVCRQAPVAVSTSQEIEPQDQRAPHSAQHAQQQYPVSAAQAEKIVRSWQVSHKGTCFCYFPLFLTTIYFKHGDFMLSVHFAPTLLCRRPWLLGNHACNFADIDRRDNWHNSRADVQESSLLRRYSFALRDTDTDTGVIHTDSNTTCTEYSR